MPGRQRRRQHRPIVWDPVRRVHHIVIKRSEKLASQMRVRPIERTFQHLDDCKGAGYAVQLSICQFILERGTDSSETASYSRYLRAHLRPPSRTCVGRWSTL